MAVLGCAGADLTRDGFVRSEIEAGGAVRSFVSFESSISLFRWRLSAPAQQQAAIAGWGHGRCRVSQGDGTSGSRMDRSRERVAGEYCAQPDEPGWVFPPQLAGRHGASPGVNARACCAAPQHAQHHSLRRASLLDCVGGAIPGGVKWEVAIALVIRMSLRFAAFSRHSPPPSPPLLARTRSPKSPG